MERLEELRFQVEEGMAANLALTKEEDQEFSLNARLRARLERKREEALAYLEKQQATALGIDQERLRQRGYTQAETEAWREKQEERQQRADPGFTDWAQLTLRRLEREAGEVRPQEISSRSPAQNLKALQAELDNDNEGGGGKRRKLRRRRHFDPTADVTYINQRNMHFNQKLARAYDAVTSELKDSLERGTAL